MVLFLIYFINLENYKKDKKLELDMREEKVLAMELCQTKLDRCTNMHSRIKDLIEANKDLIISNTDNK